jgi:hypothetical protein
VKGEATALSVRAQRCQAHYFSATPRKVSLTEPRDAVNAGLAKQTEGRRFAPSVGSLVGGRLIISPMLEIFDTQD